MGIFMFNHQLQRRCHFQMALLNYHKINKDQRCQAKNNKSSKKHQNKPSKKQQNKPSKKQQNKPSKKQQNKQARSKKTKKNEKRI
jgi:hypothetical protein